MPLRFLQKWPRTFGFEIHGRGPSYVISVEKGSMAYEAGLMPGDQILEVDGRDVTNMAADQIKTLAKSGSSQPPKLEVVSCLQTLVIKPDHITGYGFTILNEKPVAVGSVHYGGPAYQAGLRAGDIILEVNSRSTVSLTSLGTILAQKPGKLTLLTIPVARASNMVQMDKTLSRVTAPDSRLFKARDLHNKLENLMGDDYKGKMAVVGGLKRYAEDRDVTVLCKVLNDTLRTRQHRQILKQIRLLIPPGQRAQFDDLINAGRHAAAVGTLRPMSEIRSVTAHHLGQKKLIQVVREANSFGFVIKSSAPAYIESIDPGGAAEKAGLLPGDYLMKLNGLDVRKCKHERLIQLLQDSGSAPTLEILRCEKFGSIRSESTASTSSSSSHNSVDNILYSGIIKDKVGKTFTDKTTYYLTPKERSILKKALRHYDMNRDVIQLYDTLSTIFDTPSKKTLWSFVFVLLSSPHREYVSHRVNLSQEVLMEIVKSDGGRNADDIDGQEQDPTEPDISDFPPAFQQQIDFLLTSTERLQFKKCLKEYGRNHELGALAKTLEGILDTPSKRILWRLVLPRMTEGHSEVMKGRLDLRSRQTASAPLNLTAMDSYIGTPDDDLEGAHVHTTSNTDEDVLFGMTKHLSHKASSLSSSDEDDDEDGNDDSGDELESPLANRRKMKTKSRSEGKVHDKDLMRELEETKKAVQEVRDALKAQGSKVDEAIVDDLEKDLEYLDARRYVTIIPVGYPGLEQKGKPFVNKEVDSPQLSTMRKVKVPTSKGAGASKSSVFFSLESAELQDSHISHPSDDSNDEGEDAEDELTTSKDSGQSYKHSALSALSQLDAAVADETSDGEMLSHRRNTAHITLKSNKFGAQSHGRKAADNNDGDDEDRDVDDTEVKRIIEGNESKRAVNFPPPPPPLPPPLPANADGQQDASNRMSVKRINWEKLDNRSVENTIWEKFNDQELSDIIGYLELETQFSTKPSRHRDSDKRKEVLIMDRKKAYNISILLGHLKMSVSEVKQALYSMDENALSPELLGQLLAFVPNDQEIAQYKLYTGDKSQLTKPDQFAYQMSLVGDYEERLKAMKFKASFREKVEEMRESLENIRTASLELRNSKKLARLLEVILAMGNYMNKGNARVGEAAGFRITFLTQLDVTKTVDKKSSFLNVLADAAYNKFPEVLSLSDELTTVEKAAKVSIEALTTDIQDLRKAVQDISAVLDRINNSSHTVEAGDRFQDVMGHFIAEATDEIQSILRLQASTMAEFSTTVSFFGEDPKTMSVSDVFGIFSEFIKNFEKAHRHNLMFKRQ